MSTPDTSGTRAYQWRVKNADVETQIPSSNGWSFGSNTLWGSNLQYTLNNAGAMKVAATANAVPSLTASGISGTGATLTIAGHSGAWHYQGISGTEAPSTCVTVSAGDTSDTLSNLDADKLYGYTAYSGANCASGAAIDTEYFSTKDFDVGNLGETAATGNCAIGCALTVATQCAVAFSTGDRSGGYTLKSVTVRFLVLQRRLG